MSSESIGAVENIGLVILYFVGGLTLWYLASPKSKSMAQHVADARANPTIRTYPEGGSHD